MKTLLGENIGALEQAINLLPRLTAAQYRQKIAACFNASIGGHIRHNIDHYTNFLESVDSGQIDYEARRRDPLIETERDYAVEMLKTIASRLGQLDPRDREVHVRMENSRVGEASEWARSTTRRELQFLLSHTIHHYALVAVNCRLLEFDPGAEFGIAPSTQRYRHSLNTKVA